MSQEFVRFTANLSLLFFLVAVLAQDILAQTVAPSSSTIEIAHTPVTSIPAKRVGEIAVAVKDKSGVEEVRLYLKTLKRKWYVYMVMESDKKHRYVAILPPAKNDSTGLDYLFIIKNGAGKIYKTKNYRVLIQNDYRSPAPKESIQLPGYAEIASPPPLFNDFLFPFVLEPSTNPLLATAEQYKHPPIKVPGPGSGGGSGGFFRGLGGVAATITLGGVGISYRAN